MSDKKEYHPPHIYQDNTIYFISVKTIQGERYFDIENKKDVLFKVLKRATDKFNVQLFAWAILSNHYHLLFKLSSGKDLGIFIRNINENSARILNEQDNEQGRKIWYQYLDYCIRSEKDFYQHFNYIHHNPVKHKYVKEQDNVLNYKFCSYRDWIKKKGEEFMADCFEKYSIKDFTVGSLDSSRE